MYRLVNTKSRKAYLQQGGIVPEGMNPAFMPYIPAKQMVVEPIKANELPSPPSVQKPSLEIKIEKGTPLAKSYIHKYVSDEVNQISKTYTGIQQGSIDVSEGQKKMQSHMVQLEDVLRRYNTSTIAEEQNMYSEIKKEGYDGALVVDNDTPVGSVSGTISVLGNTFNGTTDLEKAFVNLHIKEGITNLSRASVYNKPTKQYSDLVNSFYSQLGKYGTGGADIGMEQPGEVLEGVILFGAKSARWHKLSNLANVKAGLDATKNVFSDADTLSFIYREGNRRATDLYKSRGYRSSVDALASAEVVFGGVMYDALLERRRELESYRGTADSVNKDRIEQEIALLDKKIKEAESKIKENIVNVYKKANNITTVLSKELGVDMAEFEKYVRAAVVSGYDIYDSEGNIDEKKKEEFIKMMYAYAVYDEMERTQFSDKSALDRSGLYYNLSHEKDPERYAFILRSELAKKLGIDESSLIQAANYLSDVNKNMVFMFGIDNKDKFDQRLARVKEMEDYTISASLSLRSINRGGGGGDDKVDVARDVLFMLMNNPESLREKASSLGVAIEGKQAFTFAEGDKTINVYDYAMNVNNDVKPPSVVQSYDESYKDPDRYYTNPNANIPPQLIIKAHANGKTMHIPLFLAQDLYIGDHPPSGALYSQQIYMQKKDKEYRKATAYQAVALPIKDVKVINEGKEVIININETKYKASVPSINQGKYREFLRTHSSSGMMFLVDPSLEGQAAVYVYNPAFKAKYATNENAPQGDFANVKVGGNSNVPAKKDGGAIMNEDDKYVKSLIDSIFD